MSLPGELGVLEGRDIFARLLPIGHRIVTWMLESVPVNVSAPGLRSRKSAVISANNSEVSVSVGDRADARSDASQRDLTMSALPGEQGARLINASCKAFFIKRGLDPDVRMSTGTPASSATDEQGGAAAAPCLISLIRFSEM